MLKILRPRTIQLYVLKNYLLSLVTALSACAFFFLLVVVLKTVTQFEEFGLTTAQAAMLAPYLLPHVLTYSVPLSTMIAATILFGKLSAENEILAAQAGGAPLRAVALPVLLVSLVLCGLCLWCNQAGISWGYSTIRDEVVKVDKLEFFENLEKPGNTLTQKLEGGGVVRINWLPHETMPNGVSRKPIHITHFQNDQIGTTVWARDYTRKYQSASLAKVAGEKGSDQPIERSLMLTLKEAQVYRQTPGVQSVEQPSFFLEYTHQLTLPQPSSIISIGETSGQRGWLDNWEYAMRVENTREPRERFVLERAADFGALMVSGSNGDPALPGLSAQSWHDARVSSEHILSSRERTHGAKAEMYRKLALSILPFSLAILGIALGLLVQKSQRLIGFLLAVVVYAGVYYPLMIISKELTISGKIGVWSAFIPNTVLLLIGYIGWRGYEHGWLTSSLPARAIGFLTSGTLTTFISRIFSILLLPFTVVRNYIVSIFRYKVGAHVAGSFLTPLVILLVVTAVLLTGFDLLEHGSEVIQGVRKAPEKFGTGGARAQNEAIMDAATYYLIRSLEMVCDMLPLLTLLAGLLCVTALVRNKEHLIMKSSGVRLQRLFFPIIFITILFSIGVFAIRETVLPGLIMTRDYLKPLVYNRNALPTALALYTADENGKAVLFEMSQYNASRREGRNLRVYMISEPVNGRVPVLVADHATWEPATESWKLRTDPPMPLPGKPAIKPQPLPANHGYVLRPDYSASGEDVAKATPASFYGDIRPLQMTRTIQVRWRGAITPSFLQSDRLGAGVLSLESLQAASKVKPELQVEWWRRVSEFSMSIFLLWLTIPFLVSESRSLIMGVGLSIMFAAAYWSLNMIAAEAGKAGVGPLWSPLIPHAVFFVIGSIHYYYVMET